MKSMNKSEALEELKQRCYDIEPLQFEHLCKMVVEEIENPDGIETTRATKDGGIDIRGYVGSEFYTGEFGIQVKQYENKITSGMVRGLAGSLQGEACRFGTLITTSSFTSDAVEKVNDTEPYSIELINGEELAELMLEYELGVKEQPSDNGQKFVTDPEFWSRFDKLSGDLIPSWKVPQADSFEVLDLVLRAIDEGNQFKPEIVNFLVRETGDSWTPRQADYYTTAAQVMGYLEEGEPDDEDINMRKWLLTESGEKYVEFLRAGAEERASDHLSEHVKNIEIIERIAEKVEEELKIPNSVVIETIREETEVTGTTVGRRASTVGKWLGKHPDVKRIEKNTVWFEYYKMDLSDF